jgi:3-hydroxyisobutyrate dehydrogenase-like beta-hydroxyacid dehydrogenase
MVQPWGADREPSFAFVGFGALGEAFAKGLRDGGAADVAVFARPRQDADAAAALERRLASAGIRRSPSLQEVARDADVIVAAVPATAAAEVAAASSPHLRSGALYVDPSPLAPAAKAELAALVGAAGGHYTDVAVLGTVAVDAHAVPMLAAGPGAARWAASVAPFGFRVSQLDGPAGRASLVKLLRSVYMKGRDALILEMLVAARRHGVEDAVLQSIGGPGEQVPFPELASRVVRSLAVYAERRSAELAAAAELLAVVDVEPQMTDAGVARLRWLADLDVRARIGGERPDDMEQVLLMVDALVAARRAE